MWTRVATVMVWALVAAAAAYWGLRLFGAAEAVPPDTRIARLQGAPGGNLTRLLGSDPQPMAAAETPQAAADPRFQLVGVVTPRSARAAAEGLAVIVVDDKPARAYRVGAVVDGQTVLQSVTSRGVSLGPKGGAAVVALDLPPLVAAATGQLPLPAARGAGVPGQATTGRLPYQQPLPPPQPPPQPQTQRAPPFNAPAVTPMPQPPPPTMVDSADAPLS